MKTMTPREFLDRLFMAMPIGFAAGILAGVIASILHRHGLIESIGNIIQWSSLAAVTAFYGYLRFRLRKVKRITVE